MGLAIRLLLVAAWVAMFALHVLRFALPGMGLVERRDLGSAVSAQLDRSLSYDIIQAAATPEGQPRRTGSCEISFQRDEGFFRLDTRFELELLPGTSLPVQLPSRDSPSPRLHLEACQKLDDHMRLTAVEGNGELGGLRATFSGSVDHRGLTGHYRFQGVSHPFALPAIGRDGNQGFDWSLSLPAGLKPGERFRAKVLDLDGLTPRQSVGVYAVAGIEPIQTRAGSLDLLRVSLEVDGKPRGVSWCDDRGTVYRVEFAAMKLAIELTRIRVLPATVVWPPPDAP